MYKWASQWEFCLARHYRRRHEIGVWTLRQLIFHSTFANGRSVLVNYSWTKIFHTTLQLAGRWVTLDRSTAMFHAVQVKSGFGLKNWKAHLNREMISKTEIAGYVLGESWSANFGRWISWICSEVQQNLFRWPERWRLPTDDFSWFCPVDVWSIRLLGRFEIACLHCHNTRCWFSPTVRLGYSDGLQNPLD